MKNQILVIDDEDLVVTSLKNLLKRDGYDVTVAQNHADALSRAACQDFDLIISDIRIPGKDGIAILKDIRALLIEKGAPPVPEFLITGYADEDKYREALALDVRAYIKKPFDVAFLLDAVRETLSESSV